MAYKENNASRILREAEKVTEMWHPYGAHIHIKNIIFFFFFFFWGTLFLRNFYFLFF